MGDFNGDGKPDLAIANFSDSNVSILLGNGNGSFQPAANYATDFLPVSVAVGDFDSDGNPDLATSNLGPDPGNVSILLGNGSGTFQPAVSYGAGIFPASVAVGDFNGDGKADLAVANNDSSVSILLGNGDGTFQQPALNYGAGANPVSVAVGDFNGDGKADLAVANEFSGFSGDVSTLFGNGDGTFQPAVSDLADVFPVSVAVGDFNGDGKPDLAVANNLSSNVSILLNVAVTGIRAEKQGVLDDLSALRGKYAGKRDCAKDLDEAIKHLSRSLDSDLWLDEFHLQPKKGKKVFNGEKHAVERLHKLIKDKKCPIPDATLQGFIDRLVAVDGQLASVAISDAIAAGLDPKKIARAQHEMAKAVRAIARGHFAAAIEHYKHAWQAVQLHDGDKDEDEDRDKDRHKDRDKGRDKDKDKDRDDDD